MFVNTFNMTRVQSILMLLSFSTPFVVFSHATSRLLFSDRTHTQLLAWRLATPSPSRMDFNLGVGLGSLCRIFPKWSIGTLAVQSINKIKILTIGYVRVFYC